MEKRIKIIYGLTAMALDIGCIINMYTLQKYEDELFQNTIDIMQADRQLRKSVENNDLQMSTQWQMKVLQNGIDYTPHTEWVFDTYIIDKNRMEIEDSFPFPFLDSLSIINKGVKKYSFTISDHDRQADVYEALESFHINESCPFRIGRFDSLLRESDIKARSIEVANSHSMIWNPGIKRHTSVWNPVMEVTYPLDILRREQVNIVYDLSVSPILERMSGSLVCSAVLSLLLVLCLIYQIRTIFKQRRVEDLRRSFIQTMIHELKRPLGTLKMCISFMKNDKMLQNAALKEDMILSSQSELDNLSSYFSKLRDLTYEDKEAIPLHLSSFRIRELIEECIRKLHLPSGRTITINTCFEDENTQLTADRMHISHVLSNLLENAVKYSEGDSSVLVNGYFTKENYRIEVSDNGVGIPASECPYVFDKYFRGTNVKNTHIPGIGLGLSYVRLLINAHKGKVSVESTLGTGTNLPLKYPESNERKYYG